MAMGEPEVLHLLRILPVCHVLLVHLMNVATTGGYQGFKNKCNSDCAVQKQAPWVQACPSPVKDPVLVKSHSRTQKGYNLSIAAICTYLYSDSDTVATVRAPPVCLPVVSLTDHDETLKFGTSCILQESA
jgi:hypothetical protein